LKVEFSLDKTGEPETATSTKITWKEGKNITIKVIKKKNKNKKKVKEVE
jgi:nucleosome assembly protein 1-like 1